MRDAYEEIKKNYNFLIKACIKSIYPFKRPKDTGPSDQQGNARVMVRRRNSADEFDTLLWQPWRLRLFCASERPECERKK